MNLKVRNTEYDWNIQNDLLIYIVQSNYWKRAPILSYFKTIKIVGSTDPLTISPLKKHRYELYHATVRHFSDFRLKSPNMADHYDNQSPRSVMNRPHSPSSSRRGGGRKRLSRGRGGDAMLQEKGGGGVFGKLRRFMSGGGILTDRKRVMRRCVTADPGFNSGRGQDGGEYVNGDVYGRRGQVGKVEVSELAPDHPAYGKEVSARVLRMKSEGFNGNNRGPRSKSVATTRRRASLKGALGWEGRCWRIGVREMKDRLANAEGRVNVLGREKMQLESRLKEQENRLKEKEHETCGLQKTVNEMEKMTNANYLERTFLQDDLADSRKEREAWCQRTRFLEYMAKRADFDRTAAVAQMNQVQLLREEATRDKIRAQEELKLLRADFNKLMMKAVSLSLDIDFTQFTSQSPLTASPSTGMGVSDGDSLYSSEGSSERDSLTSNLRMEVSALMLELEKSRNESRNAAMECSRLEQLLNKEREKVGNYEEDCAMLRQQVVSFAARHERITRELHIARMKERSGVANKTITLKKSMATDHCLEPAVVTDENCDRSNVLKTRLPQS